MAERHRRSHHVYRIRRPVPLPARGHTADPARCSGPGLPCHCRFWFCWRLAGRLPGTRSVTCSAESSRGAGSGEMRESSNSSTWRRQKCSSSVAAAGRWHWPASAWNVVGAAVWTVSCILVGIWLGHVDFIAKNIDVRATLLVLISTVPLGFEAPRRRGKGRSQGDGAPDINVAD